MKIVFYVEKANRMKAEETIGKDPVGRQSITIRDAVSLGIKKDGTYFYIDGTDEACALAREWLKNIAIETDAKERDEVIKKMEEQESSVFGGVSSIFG
ncbi:MAG: hypothetical protein HY366_03185 [Candidatus Aenigmarchaeota archaeon]|nr:hypothetical protein [Candidatus Aenigmarchaeota archaeon]